MALLNERLDLPAAEARGPRAVVERRRRGPEAGRTRLEAGRRWPEDNRRYLPQRLTRAATKRPGLFRSLSNPRNLFVELSIAHEDPIRVAPSSSGDDERPIVAPDKRLNALRTALREASSRSAPDSEADTASRRALARERTRIEAIEFVHGIALTGALIQNALDYDGSPIAPANAEHALLSVIERTEGCLAFSDLARALHVSRQRAREIAITAARKGTVELSPAPYPREMRAVAHVLQVIRRRLRRDEQERLDAAKAQSAAPRHSPSR